MPALWEVNLRGAPGDAGGGMPPGTSAEMWVDPLIYCSRLDLKVFTAGISCCNRDTRWNGVTRRKSWIRKRSPGHKIKPEEKDDAPHAGDLWLTPSDLLRAQGTLLLSVIPGTRTDIDTLGKISTPGVPCIAIAQA